MKMIQFICCLFGLHGVTETEYPITDQEIKICRDCMKKV